MPWSRSDPHPLLVQWAHRARRAGRTAVVVGCALGADAEFVAGLGFTTTAFDVSPTAIRLARERYPHTEVRYLSADLLHLPGAWQRAFDLVVEIITLQALPPEPHPPAAAARVAAAGGGTRRSDRLRRRVRSVSRFSSRRKSGSSPAWAATLSMQNPWICARRCARRMMTSRGLASRAVV
jgi:ubiquinone/menaquinone biosynthesis C-methylase UbiE